MLKAIIRHIALLGNLSPQIEGQSTALHQPRHLIKQVVVPLGPDLLHRQRLEPRRRLDPVPDERPVPVRVDQPERLHREEALGCEAPRRGLGQLHEGPCLGVRPQVGLEGPVTEGAEEGERLVARGAREGVDAVTNDVGVPAARVRGELEAQGEAVGLGVGRGVREVGDAGG